eukprot:CAMPEP_0197515576 /NCGR_PEP_ID=MMETSP1318-20131121/670_1 /TAXON_ID=552666 /ORGANISM="Partenskyella glossopodia, Strain RCC365" /LENGTH=87 /DNA_ID=CAMNT_0043063989 /DNA_START=171 /DNA_END=434 /DNA_ORIENTATION=+
MAIKTVALNSDTAGGSTCGGRLCPKVDNAVCCDTDQYCCRENTACVAPNRMNGDLNSDWLCVKTDFNANSKTGRPLKILYGEAPQGQ